MEPVDAQLRLGPPSSGGALAATDRKYVKVSIQGAPYLRQVDLRAYGGYAELRAALLSLTGQQLDLAVAYEDEDGDLMLVGDLPWDMFVDSCKKLLIYKRRLI
ncbi:auxin-responsive protein IAA14-like [Aegilops tauschii subsp. strangulata]|uniref:Auxin-responsive protein n=1 Tax=Aegilops tauschii TaxID=37682 RepID=N1R2H4_AEGTA|nr:auxin-responsive protein IAA14-like [Aegilops tauschii subsp. strangulata]